MEVVIVKNKLDIKTAVADYAIMLAGAAVYATSVVVFTAPNDIAPGGLDVYKRQMLFCVDCLHAHARLTLILLNSAKSSALFTEQILYQA